LEIISPVGFEKFSEELSDMGGVTKVTPSGLGDLCSRYALEMKPESVPELVQRFDLCFPGEPVKLAANGSRAFPIRVGLR
jgi:hypothetical protein